MLRLVDQILSTMVIALIISAVVYGVLAIVRFKKLGFRKHLTHFVFITYIVIVLIGSFSPQYGTHVSYARLNLIPFNSIWQAITGYSLYGSIIFESILLNTVLLMPLGILAPMVFKKPKSVSGIGAVALVIAAVIEITQLVFSSLGRSFDVDDIILNTLGAIIGYLLYTLIFSTINTKKTDELEI